MEMQISNASEFPLYHSMAAGPHSFQLPGGIPPVSTIPSYKNAMFPDRLGFYYDAAGAAPPPHHPPPERCEKCYLEVSIGVHFGKKLCGSCVTKEHQQQQASPKVDAEILDLDSQQVMSQQQQQQRQQQHQQQQQQQQQDHPTNKGFLVGGGAQVVPPGYDCRAAVPPPPPPPPPAVSIDWPGFFPPQQNTLSGEHLSPDYNNVTTTTTTPPTMMGGSPSSDMQQQYQGNFDGGGYAVDSNQQSGGGGGGGSGSKGNGSWKSNEARRAKTYECPACDKWFTSSGHLKRHYGTQLHKNAVKQSGKPDPALLPMKHHYHPYRDPAYVAQQKLKQQQNGGVPPSLQQQHCTKQQQQQMGDYRPVTSSTSSFLHTDSFLELTPPNLTASLSDSLGGTHYHPQQSARRPASSNSSSSNNNNNSNCSTAAGFTDAMQTSSYISSSISNSHNISYPADLTAHLRRPPVTSYPRDPSPLMASEAVHRARSAYRRHPNTTNNITTTTTPTPNTTMPDITIPGTTIPRYTTQVSTTRPAINTDSYTTMPVNNDHFYRHRYDLEQLQQHYPYPPVDYPMPSSTSPFSPPPPSQHHPAQVQPPPPPYPRYLLEHHQQQQQLQMQQQQQMQHQQHQHLQQHQQLQQQLQNQQQQQQQQQQHPQFQQWHQPTAPRPTVDELRAFRMKTEPEEYAEPDLPAASPDSSDDHLLQRPGYSGLLVVAPVPSPSYSPASDNPLVMDEDAEVTSDCSTGGSDSYKPPLMQQQQQQQQQEQQKHQMHKKCRKATRVTCEPCNKEFSDKCYKTQHDQRFHSGEKPYRCGVCGKRFGEVRLLELHELRHNDVNKAFPCTVCSKSFNFKNDLDRHFMSSHSVDKPYECEQCKKKFVRLDHKRHHERTHGLSGSEKPRRKRSNGSPEFDGGGGGVICYGSAEPQNARPTAT